jgi:hypothetical protein
MAPLAGFAKYFVGRAGGTHSACSPPWPNQRLRTFEVENDDLPIERFQTLDQQAEALQRFAPAGGKFTLLAAGQCLDAFHAQATL